MFDLLTYHSADPAYKEPYGAVPTGTAVRFSLRPDRAGGFSRGVLLARFEFRDNQTLEIPMPWEGTELGRDCFSCLLDTGDYVGLVWYSFRLEPDQYDSWWGIYSLPAVNESDPAYLDYIIRGENSIVRRWLRSGADGWRLDVADELPDPFISALHRAVREEKSDAVVIGEVWEDGTTKIAYDVRRRHLLGGHLDGLMNYPFRNALVAFLLGGDARCFMEAMERLRENYPPFAFHSAMNFLGTHDTPRIITLLGVGSDCKAQPKAWRAGYRMTEEEYARGAALLKAGATVLYAFPGSPTLYYGDEAGLEGFEDPFNRRTFPWGREDEDLTAHFRALGQARHDWTALRQGDLQWLAAKGPHLAFTRSWGEETVLAAVNLGENDWLLSLGEREILLPPMTSKLLRL